MTDEWMDGRMDFLWVNQSPWIRAHLSELSTAMCSECTQPHVTPCHQGLVCRKHVPKASIWGLTVWDNHHCTGAGYHHGYKAAKVLMFPFYWGACYNLQVDSGYTSLRARVSQMTTSHSWHSHSEFLLKCLILNWCDEICLYSWDSGGRGKRI